jgi:uncharacterized protein
MPTKRNPTKQQPTGMTTQEAGRKGGQTTAKRYGPEFYEEIGRKGGQAVSDKYGPEFYGEIGRKGGQKVKELIEAGKRAGSRR